MNGRLPPTDDELREQLARRAAGRVPDTLLAETYSRLDAAPQRARRIAPRALQMPKLGLAGAGLAAVLLLAVAVGLPALRSNPAGPIPGYPAERALTTSELTDVMAGPALSVNTPLVASVTIQARTDVCPMNRYPTLGVIEGMGSQVCVMGAGVYEYLTAAGVSGTFAFRYLAPGYLGLLSEVTPASSGLSFGVAQDWPLTGKAFLVRGYLGLTKLPCAEETAVSPGDPLNPNGDEQCAGSWLSDDGSPAPVRSFPTWAPTSMPSPGGSVDLLKLTGKARLVQAGGARLIDSIPDATTLGVYVVKAATGPCPGAAPYSSVGCPVWRVLAKVPELSLQAAPTATAAETMPKIRPPNPTTAAYWDPAVRPLTTAELPRALTVAQTGQLLVAEVSLENAAGCGGFNGYKALGRIAGPANEVCVVGIADTKPIHRPATSTGTFAFRVLGPNVLGYLGTIGSVGSMGLAYSANEAWPADQTIVVYGWLAGDPMPRGCTAIGATDALDPASAGCTAVWLTGTQKTFAQASADAGTGGARLVFEGILPSDDSAVITAGQASAYLLRDERSDCSGTTDSGPQHWCGWEVMGHIAPVTLPTVTAPPATPIAAPTLPSGVGLIGPGGRPLTTAELMQAWAADPNHLVGRIAIVDGGIPTNLACSSANASPYVGDACDVLIGLAAPVAVKVATGGGLSILGQLALPTSSGVVFAVTDACGDRNLAPGAFLVVSGVLVQQGGTWRIDHTGTVDASATCASIDLGAGAYESMGPALPSGYAGEAPRGYYLVQVGGPWKLLARLQPLAGQG